MALNEATNTNNLKFQSLLNTLSRSSIHGKFTPDAFDSDEDNLSTLQNNIRLLVIGCGKLGTEIVKNLLYSGFTDIEIIDRATILEHNTSIPHLIFRTDHFGSSKSHIIAQEFKKKHPKITITAHHKDTTAEKRSDYYIKPTFYTKFDFIIITVKSLNTKSKFNKLINDLISYDWNNNTQQHIPDHDSIIPWIDAYSYNTLHGDISVFIPTVTACFECNLTDRMNMLQRKMNKYGHIRAFQQYEDEKYTQDISHAIFTFRMQTGYRFNFTWYNEEHITSLFNILTTQRRAKQLLPIPKNIIRRILRGETEDVSDNIWISLCFINSVIAGIVCNEVFKLISGCSLGVNNRFKYNGYNVDKCKRVKDIRTVHCGVCGIERVYCLKENYVTFGDLFHKLQTQVEGRDIVSITDNNNRALYHRIKFVVEQYKENFDKKMYHLMGNGTVIVCLYSGRLVKEIKVDWTEYIVVGWFRNIIEKQYKYLQFPYAIQLLIAKFVESDSQFD
eukprot:59403_1